MARIREHLFGLNSGSSSRQYRHSGFDELFYDSVHLANMAQDQAARELEDDYTGECLSATLARASSISSMLTVECAANCCLDILPWRRGLRDDIDKLPALSKLELFLKSRPSTRELDRGSTSVQGVEELKALRDRFVHPKVRRAEWTPVTDTTLKVDLGVSKGLGLPFDTGLWGPKDSIVALRAVVEFFNYFFLDLCELDSNQTCEILVGDGDLSNPAGYDMDGMGELKRAAEHWQISFRFLGVVPIQRNHATVSTMDGGLRARTADQLGALLTGYLHEKSTTTYRILSGSCSAQVCELSINWFEDTFHRVVISVVDRGTVHWLINHHGPRGLSFTIHEWLVSETRYSVRWLTEDEWAENKTGQPLPW